MTLTSRSPTETEAIGRALAAALHPGDVLLLDGPLGAGKTALVRAIAAGLGADPALVSSPTFVLVQEYEALAGPIVHADAYRLPEGDADALATLGWDGLATPAAIVLIEWGQRLVGLVEHTASVRIRPEGDQHRRIDLRADETWRERPGLARLAAFGPVPPEPARTDTTCPVTGAGVRADAPTWPFVDERARLADLYRWLTE